MCLCIVSVLALRNWGYWQPRHHMYCLPFSSLPSIRSWDQLNGTTLAGRCAHCKVKQIHRVRRYCIQSFNGQRIIFGHTDKTRKESRNYNRKYPKEILIQQWCLCILTELRDKLLQTGSCEICNFQISKWQRESPPHVRISFGSYTMEGYIKRRGMTLI